MSFTKITDHKDKAKALLLSQFKNSTKLRQLIDSIVEEIQQVEDAIFDICTLRTLDNAEGVQLDEIGDIVQQPRNGEDDDDYRDSIKFKIFINVSNATPEIIIESLRRLTNSTNISFKEVRPASVQLFADGTGILIDIVNFLQSILPAGVDNVSLAVTDGNEPFVFASDNSTVEPLETLDGEQVQTVSGEDIEVNILDPEAIAEFGDGFADIIFEDLVTTGGEDIVLITGEQVGILDKDDLQVSGGGYFSNVIQTNY